MGFGDRAYVVAVICVNLTRINRKSEARNSKLETNPKYKYSNVQNMESKLLEIIMVADQFWSFEF